MENTNDVNKVELSFDELMQKLNDTNAQLDNSIEKVNTLEIQNQKQNYENLKNENEIQNLTSQIDKLHADKDHKRK